MRSRLCRCGHDRTTHEHLRRGSDCGACGHEVCARFHRSRATGRAAGRVVAPLELRRRTDAPADLPRAG